MERGTKGKRNAGGGLWAFLDSRWLVVLICAAGVGSVAYGMSFENNPAFIFGLALVVTGYLIIRKRLKDSIKSAERRFKGGGQ